MGNICIRDDDPSIHFTCSKCYDPCARHGRSWGFSDRPSCRYHDFISGVCNDCGGYYGRTRNCYHRQ